MGSLVIYRKSCESSEEAGSDFDRLYDFVHEFTGREPELREHGFVDIWLGFRVFSPKSFRGVLPCFGFPFRDVNGCLVGRREDCTAGDCYDVVFSLWDMSREGRKAMFLNLRRDFSENSEMIGREKFMSLINFIIVIEN